VLEQIERETGEVLEKTLIKDIDRLVRFRNHIVHMSYQQSPNKYQPLLNTAQMAHVAALAGDCARHYLDFLSTAFSELNLPIRTIRPHYHCDDGWPKGQCLSRRSPGEGGQMCPVQLRKIEMFTAP
jgi:hypothetical protein